MAASTRLIFLAFIATVTFAMDAAPTQIGFGTFAITQSSLDDSPERYKKLILEVRNTRLRERAIVYMSSEV